MSSRFDLEQNIMNTWNVCDDLGVLLAGWDSLTEDQRQNYLIGLQQMYRLKFERLWTTFEGCISNQDL